eukprot:Protomagalhaensia_wolfi_Nauph_80__4971@NODE_524_length_2381_cov_11_054654_g390_i0_p2_GENE_NODE_524_length_2381_cov_11_054654_g390_i0NODE_524_length_2381_cov_11_054654_g390_i0_p2_ORF_typecomplete_len355_score54_37Leu_Phe_trans/PF03588_14/2_6e33_NODE_524_length_2381_cov_11_054654_g390_i013132377
MPVAHWVVKACEVLMGISEDYKVDMEYDVSFDSEALENINCINPKEVLLDLHSNELYFEALLQHFIRESSDITYWNPQAQHPPTKNITDILESRVDYVWSLKLTPDTFRTLTIAGFLCIGFRCLIPGFPNGSAVHIGVLLAKMHDERCIVKLDEPVLKAHKSALRRLNKAVLTFDKDFDAVAQGLRNQHGDDNWVHIGLCKAYKSMSPANSNDQVESDLTPVWHSVELWMNGELVAGELGVVTGSCYGSLSGFHSAKGSGSLQLLALKLFLMKLGFQVWDLGMYISYKTEQGAMMVGRDQWLEIFDKAKSSTPNDKIPINVPIQCSELRAWYTQNVERFTTTAPMTASKQSPTQ